MAAVEGPQDASKSGETTESGVTAKSGEGTLSERQWGDPDLRQVLEYLETGKLPSDQKRARELVLSRQQYVVVDGVLYYVAGDKTVPPVGERESLFREVHGGVI